MGNPLFTRPYVVAIIWLTLNPEERLGFRVKWMLVLNTKPYNP